MRNVAINGLGRIGRLTLRSLLSRPELTVVAVSDRADGPTLAHLLTHDSIHGTAPTPVTFRDGCLHCGDRAIPCFPPTDPGGPPFSALGAQVLLECTGAFPRQDQLAGFLTGSVRQVLAAGPVVDAEATFVSGLNDQDLDWTRAHIVAVADPATQCLGMLCEVLHTAFGLEQGFITVVESYKSDQRILDLPHADLRLARAATQSMIPAPTPAPKELGRIRPHVQGLLEGLAVRVPTPDGCLLDLTARLHTPADPEAIHGAFRRATDQGPLARRLEVLTAPLVSSDLMGRTASCLYDPFLTQRLGERLVKVFGWFDNESAGAARLVEAALLALEARP